MSGRLSADAPRLSPVGPALLLAVVFLLASLGEGRAQPAWDDEGGLDTAAEAQREGYHLGLQLALPYMGASEAGLTQLGGELTLRRGVFMAEGDAQMGRFPGGGDGVQASGRVGVVLGGYWSGGAARVGLTGGVAALDFTNERARAEVLGLGGEIWTGYLSPMGLEIRLAIADYGVVAGDYRPGADAPRTLASFGRVGLSVGYEL